MGTIFQEEKEFRLKFIWGLLGLIWGISIPYSKAAAPFTIAGVRAEGMGVPLSKPPTSDNSFATIDNPESTVAGGSVTAISNYFIGLGLSQVKYTIHQNYFLKQYNYRSGTTETIDLTSVELSSTFGRHFSIMGGVGYAIGTSGEIEYDNPVCKQFNRIASDIEGINLIVGIGTPLYENLKFALGYRVTYANITFSDPDLGTYKYKRTFSFVTAGLSYFF